MQSCLIIQTAFFGDVILATALVEQLILEFPKLKIDFLVQKSREVLLENNPHLRHVYVFDKSKKFRSALHLIRTFRRQKYDLVVNVHRHGTSGLLTALAGGKETVGFHVHPLSMLFDRVVEHHREGRHEIERNYELISHLTSKTIQRPRLYPNNTDREAVRLNLSYVTISPASVWETKQWPVASWSQLVDKIPNHVQIFLLGGPTDRDLCEQVVSKSNRVAINRAGELTFLQSAALMSKAVMNYTNDSAPVHMASAVNAPVTAVFCSTIPAFGYGPLSDESYVLETDEKLSCRPCGVHGNNSCPEGHFKCSAISLQKVYVTMADKTNGIVEL